MKFYIVFASVMVMGSCGVISHESSDGHKATSYQNIHIQHFHAVPTYVKKEHAHLLEHPIPQGETSAQVKVHHGDKHDHGYATSNVHSDLTSGHESYEPEGHKYEEAAASGHAGAEAASAAYEPHTSGHYKVSAEPASGHVYSQAQAQEYDGHDLSHFQGHEYQGAAEEQQGLGHYH